MMPLIQRVSHGGTMEAYLIQELRYEMGNTTGR
jgi:hypothetical protein